MAGLKNTDAKPLPVGGFSKDKQTTGGQAAKVKAKGYALPSPEGRGF